MAGLKERTSLTIDGQTIEVRNPLRPLGREKQCTLPCCTGRTSSTKPDTKDHIFPIKAGNEHPMVLGSLIQDENDLIRICENSHKKIDHTKIYVMYMCYGLSGLVEFAGNYYPRVAEEFLERQQSQWEYVFSKLGDRISTLRAAGRISSQNQQSYDQAQFVIDRCLNRWEKGRFGQVQQVFDFLPFTP